MLRNIMSIFRSITGLYLFFYLQDIIFVLINIHNLFLHYEHLIILGTILALGTSLAVVVSKAFFAKLKYYYETPKTKNDVTHLYLYTILLH